MTPSTDPWTAMAGPLLCGVAIAAFVWWQLHDEASFLRRLWTRYVGYVGRELRFLMSPLRAHVLAGAHVAAVVVHLVVVIDLRAPLVGFFLPVTLLCVPVLLARSHRKRVTAIEDTVAVWLLAVANALKSSPSIGEAVRVSAGLVGSPLRDELDVMIHEMRLGVPLPTALLSLGDRVGSQLLSSVITTLLVARRTGGDLPKVLERTSATVREMERLEGVVRTKTAEGKSQGYVLGAVPFLMSLALNWLDPSWFASLTSGLVGYAILGAAITLWVGSILVARKVLAVDI